MKRSKAEIVSLYDELKAENGGEPLKVREFIKRSGVTRRELEAEFGAYAYSRLQELAGDKPNRLVLKKTATKDIMTSYGDLAMEVLKTEYRLPVAADWKEQDIRPTESGLSASHGIKWSEFPSRFLDYCEKNKLFRKEYSGVLRAITECAEKQTPKHPISDALFEEVCTQLRTWSPAMRRSVEEAYKSELSRHLRQIKSLLTKGLEIREEKSDSRCDIGVGADIGIEVKKSPILSDYDRCFGQVARHLKSFKFVAVIVFDVPKQDQFEDFCKLVDQYYGHRVRVIKNG